MINYFEISPELEKRFKEKHAEYGAWWRGWCYGASTAFLLITFIEILIRVLGD